MENQRVSSPVVVKSLLASKWQLNTLEWLVGATSAHEVFCVGMMKNNEYITLPDEEPIMPGPVLLVVMVARSSYMQKC